MRLLQENAEVTETLNEVGALVSSDLDRTSVQAVTDAATELTTAEFGAFFYNVINESGESYTLYTISGVPREAFSKFPMPRNTEVFDADVQGTGVVRSDDITRIRATATTRRITGCRAGHLPVRSYLAVPVKGALRRGDRRAVLRPSEVGRFTEQHERLAVGIAAWASVALENARLYSSVQEASRLKDEFLASLSHELRTPLNAILGYARMLRSGMIAPDKQQKAIETIERNATSLTQIVEDVLDVSRIVSGKIRLNVQPVDLPDDRARGRRRRSRRPPTPRASASRPCSIRRPAPISGDPERLQQVLWNLLSNAVKFTQPRRQGAGAARARQLARRDRRQRHRHRHRAGVPAARLRAVPSGRRRDHARARRTRPRAVDRAAARSRCTAARSKPRAAARARARRSA